MCIIWAIFLFGTLKFLSNLRGFSVHFDWLKNERIKLVIDKSQREIHSDAPRRIKPTFYKGQYDGLRRSLFRTVCSLSGVWQPFKVSAVGAQSVLKHLSKFKNLLSSIMKR